MRGLHLLLIVPCLLASVVSAFADSNSDLESSLLNYAVTVNRTPKQTWGEGAGIYLGQGLVLTAAHVVGMTWLTRPKVIVSGQEFSTSTVREGSFETIDLTLLSFDESALPLRYRMRRAVICSRDPWPGENVVTVIPGHLARSNVISPSLLPAETRKFNTVIGDVKDTGNSGSGVFDVQHGCLLGIMSRKISRSVTNRLSGKQQVFDIAKYFVPASVIASFIPPRYNVARTPNQ